MAPKNAASPAVKRATRSSNGKAPSKPASSKPTSTKPTKKAVGRTNSRAAGNGRASTPRPPAQTDNKLSKRVVKVFARSERQAGKVVKDPKQTEKLAKDATQKADERRVELGDVFTDLQALLRLTSAYAKGDYRVIPASTIVAAVGAVIYFVSPIDAIPDVIPGFGLVDDAAVLYFVVKAIASDLDDFRGWEDEQETAKARTPRPRKPTGASARPPRRAVPKSTPATGKPASRTTAKKPTAKAAAPKTAAARTRKAAGPSARKA